MITAREGKRSVSVTRVKSPSVSSSATTRCPQWIGCPNCLACAVRFATRSFARTFGKPATSKMNFSG
jgi:hypothetical protein